jgi:hypothetical protein
MPRRLEHFPTSKYARMVTNSTLSQTNLQVLPVFVSMASCDDENKFVSQTIVHKSYLLAGVHRGKEGPDCCSCLVPGL